MLIPKNIFEEMRKKFPSFYGAYQPIEGEKVFIFCTGEKKEKIKKEIQNFLEENVSLLIDPSFVFTEEIMTLRQMDSLFYN